MAYHSKYTGAEVDALLDKVNDGDVGKTDSSLSTTSERPVQNKVITEELNKKVNKTDMATINGQPLTEGGNIVIEGGEGGSGTLDSEVVSSTEPTEEFPQVLYTEQTLTESQKGQAMKNIGVTDALAKKQENLVSGKNIKTVNGESILGSGDIVIPVYDDSELRGKVTELSENTELVSGTIDVASGNRVSRGIVCPTGKIVVRLSIQEGTDNSAFTIYRYTNNAFNSIVLASGITLGESVEVEVPEGDSGIWLFTSNNYPSVRKFAYAIGKGLSGDVVKIEQKAEDAASQGYLDVPFSIQGETIVIFGYASQASRWKRTDFFPAIAGTRISCYDTGGSSGTGLFFFNEAKQPLTYMALSAGYHDIVLDSENIPEGAYYAIASGEGMAYYRVWIPMQEIAEQSNTAVGLLKGLKEDMTDITGKIADYRILSTHGRIKVYVDETPEEEEYYIQVDCDTPPVEAFGIFKCAKDHSGLANIGYTSWGQPFKVTRDADKPSLYVFSTTGEDASIEGYTIKVSFKAVTSLADEVNAVVENNSWKNKTIVCFGDSITENQDFDNGKAYADYIHDIMGAKVYNIGIGGTQFRQRVTPVDTPTNASQAYAALDIINMVKACCEQEFSKQIAATNYLTSNNLNQNDAIIERMQSIDWSKVDLVTIFGGTNDWNNAPTSWGELSKENTDINTTFGAMNEIVRLLLTTYPHLVIYWFTPTVRWIASSLTERTDETWSDNVEKNGSTLKDFSANVESLVKLHHLPVCDMYNTLGWNQWNFSQYFSDTDGTHPRKGKGTEQIARKIVAFINANRTF